MQALEGTDLFRLDELLTDEERMARNTVRDFVQREFLPIVQKHFREGSFPLHLATELGRLGVLGANLKGYGCAGMGEVAYGLILQELERGDSGLRSFASVQGSLCMYPIHAYGSEAQKERWLPKLARGEAIACFGLTEPDVGSDPGSLRTIARRDGQGYVLTGSKLWITNGTAADLALIWAKTDGGGPDSIRGFLVERGTPGLSAREIEGKFSMRASLTSELRLEEVRVGDASVLPGAVGLRAPLSCLNQARFGIAWGATGAAIACYEAARDYAQSRTQFGRPIGSFQLIQERLADMLTEIVKAQLVNLRLGRLKEEGKADPVLVSLAKRNNVASALAIARSARAVLGANGIVDAYPVIRHLLNLETVYTYEGTHEVHTLILGRAITGIDAFS